METETIVLGAFGAPGNPLTAFSFESGFTITSSEGTVEGTKSLEGFAESSLGLCGDAAFEAADSLHFEGNVGYTATITTPNGSRMDSGVSFVNFGDTQIRDAGGSTASASWRRTPPINRRRATARTTTTTTIRRSGGAAWSRPG